MASFRLRRAGPDDAALLSRLKIAVYALTYRHLLPADLFRNLGSNDPYMGVAFWRRRLLDPEQDIHVVEMGEPAGFTAVVPPTVEFPGARAVLDQLYLLPAWQNSGLGSALWQAVTESLPRPFALSVFEGHHRARRLYEARGGRITGNIVLLEHRGQPFREIIYTFDH